MPSDAELFLLEVMPRLLHQVLAELSPTQARQRGAAGAFSFAEHCWHLADLEREGYGVRLTRLLTEDAPRLADFEGERAARERRYQESDPVLAVAVFADTRARNLASLRALGPAELARAGTQDLVGPVTVGDLPRMMVEHDRSHAEEIAALVAEVAPEARVLEAVRARATARLDPPTAPPADRSGGARA